MSRGRCDYPAVPSGCPLSPAQLAVLREQAKGKTRKQIAVEFGISVSAVWSLISRACGRLGVNARSDAAVLLCQQEGWLVVRLAREKPLDELERAYVAAFSELIRRSPDARQRLLDAITSYSGFVSQKP